MSREQLHDSTPIQDLQTLRDFYLRGIKTPENRRVGTEHEKFVYRKDLYQSPLMQFHDPRGIQFILQGLCDKFQWEAQYDGANILSLTRNRAAISLEPAGQFELSGAPFLTIHETQDETNNHFKEIKEVAKDFAAICLWGTNPFATGSELPWMPRDRYQIMRRYMATKGQLGQWMMQTTATIQANYDYTSLEDASDIIHTAILISPIVNAIFANSPVVSHHDTGYQSFRGHIWTQTDSDRCGVPDFMYRPDFSIDEYIEWTINIPMYFLLRDKYQALSSLTFKTFLEEGYQNHTATLGDYELHLSTLFPEVRMKQYIEVRCADGGPISHIQALPAFWKGILYDATARSLAQKVLTSRYQDHRELFHIAAKQGLHAQNIEGKPMHEHALNLLHISKDGLERIAAKNQHPTEAIYLEPLFKILNSSPLTSLADTLASDFKSMDRSSLIDHYDVLK